MIPKAKRAAACGGWADQDVLCLTAMIRDVDHYLKGEPLEARPDLPHKGGTDLGIEATYGLDMGAMADLATLATT